MVSIYQAYLVFIELQHFMCICRASTKLSFDILSSIELFVGSSRLRRWKFDYSKLYSSQLNNIKDINIRSSWRLEVCECMEDNWRFDDAKRK